LLIELPMAEALALLALTEASRDEAAIWGSEFPTLHDRPLISEGKRVEGDEATLQKLREAVHASLTERLARFLDLRIVRVTGARSAARLRD
jgi:hypothetical protein